MAAAIRIAVPAALGGGSATCEGTESRVDEPASPSLALRRQASRLDGCSRMVPAPQKWAQSWGKTRGIARVRAAKIYAACNRKRRRGIARGTKTVATRDDWTGFASMGRDIGFVGDNAGVFLFEG